MASLTEEQKQQWATEGYFILKGALSPATVARLIPEVEIGRAHV